MVDTSDSEISNITEINSDDELPSDSIGDYSIISLKGVLKEIVSCGSGYEKPGIGDELIIEMEYPKVVDSTSSHSDSIGKNMSYVQGDKNVKLILGDHPREDYDSTGKREIPWGVELALRKMLRGEKSRILVKKDSVFSKPRNHPDRINENSILSVDYKNYNNRSRKLINLIKEEAEEFDVFTITLHNFYHIDSICDGVSKKIWRKGVHLLKSPGKKDTVELLISKLNFESALDNFAILPRLSDSSFRFNWRSVFFCLDKLSDDIRLIGEIFGNKTISVDDLARCILSMKLGEISEFRFYCSNNKKFNVLVHLTGFHWEKNIPIKLPFNKNIKNNCVKLSSFESESPCHSSSSINGRKTFIKRISSLNMEHNTILDILLENFTLVDNNNPGKRIELSLPLKSTENLKSAMLQITPGFYNLPIWLEQSIMYCFLGGKYTIKIPSSIIFLFPPTEIIINPKSEIQRKTAPVIISYNNNNPSTLNSNACNNVTADKLHAIWEAGKLIRELESVGYIFDEKNVDDDFGVTFELDLSICTSKVVENYIPVSLNIAEKEFEHYYYLGNVINDYNDLLYKVAWNTLALEVFDRFLFAATLLPFYSKLSKGERRLSTRESNNDLGQSLVMEKENKNSIVNTDKNKQFSNPVQKLITLKYDPNFLDTSEDLEKSRSIDDSILLVSQDVIGSLGNKEREMLKSLIHVINIMIKIHYDMQQFEKCSSLLEKYRFFMELKSDNSSLVKLSPKNSDFNSVTTITTT